MNHCQVPQIFRGKTGGSRDFPGNSSFFRWASKKRPSANGKPKLQQPKCRPFLIQVQSEETGTSCCENINIMIPNRISWNVVSIES